MHRKIIFKDITSSIYRAMLKPVYRFGIPNSDPRTLKNANLIHLKIDKSSLFVVTEPRERCFALFRMQNNQTFLVFHPWTPLGAPPPPPLILPSCTTAFLLATPAENPAPNKNCWIQHWKLYQNSLIKVIVFLRDLRPKVV